MANYVAFARSNYFGVTDPALFQALCTRWNLEMITEDGKYGFLCEEGLPDDCMPPEFEQKTDFTGELAALLLPGDVAVMQEIGFEKLRYLVGYARAINHLGEEVSLSINDIYERAKDLGPNITTCEY